MIKNLNLKPIVLLLLAALFAPRLAMADSFEVDGISYQTLSATEVEVVKPTEGVYTGDITVPGGITYNDQYYYVTAVGQYAFQGSTATSIKLSPVTVRTLKDRSFNDASLTSFIVPASVTEIENNAFLYCDKITDLYFYSTTPPVVYSQTFQGMKKSSCVLHVPTGCKAAYQAVTQFNAFTNIEEWDLPEVYDLQVIGYPVTTINEDVFGDGTVVYYPSVTRLVVNRDLVSPDNVTPVIYNLGIEGITIQLNNCTLTSTDAFCVDVRNGKETTLTGTGTIKGNVYAVYCWAPLNIQDATLNLSGAITGSTAETLSIKNSSLMGTVASGSAITGFNDVQLTNCFYQSPVGAQYTAGQLVDGSGNPASSFVIKAGTPTSYGLYLAGTQVTDANCYDILGGGEASYDPTSNTLTLNGPITAIQKGDDEDDHKQYAIDNVKIYGLIINVDADVTVSSAQSTAIRFAFSTYIKGSHKLTIMAPQGKGIYAKAGALEISNTDVSIASCYGGIVGNPEKRRVLNLNQCTVQGNSASGHAVISGFRECNLSKCYFEEPVGGKYVDMQLIDLDGNPATSVKIVQGEIKYGCGLEFPRDAYIASVGKAFTAPELTNPKEKAVTYASSNAAVAEVNATTGEVTVKGKGITTISATFAGDDTYYADKASYYLVVSKQDGLQYDVNLDGQVSITDAVSVVNAILNGVASAPAMDTPQEPAPEANPE